MTRSNTGSVYELAGKRVFVAGHRGMVGAGLVRRLQNEHCDVMIASRSELDLMRQDQVENWFADNAIEVVFLAAAKVGGIHANNIYPAEFLYNNLMIEANIIDAAHRSGVEKLVFLGSSCIYPKFAKQPMAEEELLTGELEPTNEPYAIAKIAGLKMCEAYRRQYGSDFISGMPTNLYGEGDNYDLETSHVIPALIRKVHEAKVSESPTVTIWGSGSPMREFLYVDDCADALVYLAKHYSGQMHVNIGCGEDISIRKLAEIICEVLKYPGALEFDTSKPDGTPRKLLDVSRLNQLGWQPSIDLKEGIAKAYAAFLAELENGRWRD